MCWPLPERPGDVPGKRTESPDLAGLSPPGAWESFRIWLCAATMSPIPGISIPGHLLNLVKIKHQRNSPRPEIFLSPMSFIYWHVVYSPSISHSSWELQHPVLKIKKKEREKGRKKKGRRKKGTGRNNSVLLSTQTSTLPLDQFCNGALHAAKLFNKNTQLLLLLCSTGPPKRAENRGCQRRWVAGIQSQMFRFVICNMEASVVSLCKDALRFRG